MTRDLLSFMVAFLCIATQLHAQDTTPPIIFCPGSATINLSPGECDAQHFFDVFASDDALGCTPNIAQTDGTGYESGSVFPIGTTVLSFQATDCAGNSSSCSFSVNVVAFNPPSAGLVCDDFLNISMPGTCEMWLLPEVGLEGNYGCYDDFTVEIGNTGSNYIGYYNVGQTLIYHITNNETGNTCWGLAFIEDKVGPLITNCNDVTINCLQDPSPISEGGEVPEPSFYDCTDFTYSYIDMVTQGACSDAYSQILMRMWTAVDDNGYLSDCAQIITVERHSLLTLSPQCPDDVVMECVPGISPDISPANTGYPTVVINGETFEITEGANSVCNITATYADMTIPKCGVGFRIVRTWTVLDWCLPVDGIDNPWTCTQVIHYNDTTAPQVTPPANMTVSANLPGCRARPVIPASTITDCSSYTVSISTPVGPINGNGGVVPAPGLALGTHVLTIKVTDACGNASTTTVTVTVQDNTKPTPVCDQNTVVVLDNTGYAFANATTFDDGSTDNCCVSGFAVARMSDNCGFASNLLFDNYIEFCCEDVGTNVPVILRVSDCHGNFNDCMVQVTVQDKTGPTITCPPNITLTCGDDYTNPSVVGEVVTDPLLQGPNDGLAADNCGASLTVVSSDMGSITCGAGTVYRTYLATDPSGASNFCVQVIQVNNNNPFLGNNIVFPPDVTLNSCTASTDPSVTGQPTIPPSTSCYTLVVGSQDQLLTTVPDACRKILRTWTVLDWCQYNPNVPNSPGRWDHVQVIAIMDTQAPTIAPCPNLTFCNFKADCSDQAPNLAISATDNCTATAQIKYTWTVDLNDDGNPDPGYVVSGLGQNTTHNYPLGTHRISYAVADGCGNTSFCNFLFTIEDCKLPTPICSAGLIIEIMPTGMVPVNVAQLVDASTNDNCSDFNDLQFSFSNNVNDQVRIFTCDEVGSNDVEVWITDEAGNQDFCVTPVIVQDNMNACGSPLVAMLGNVATEEAEGVEEVVVNLNGSPANTGQPMASQTQTNGLGGYQFANLPMGYDYSVTPSLDVEPLNGVTTFDLLLLHRHVLGMELLDSPYKLIAGDVNRTGVLSVTDVVDLRKLILHIEEELPNNNTSWRFVDGTYAFPNPQNPFTPGFPEVCNVNNLTATNQNVNFVAVKVGDLNGNAATNLAATGDERFDGAEFPLLAQDRWVNAGETFTVDFDAVASQVLGYQFTMNFDREALTFEKLSPAGNLSLENFGLTALQSGALTVSWYQLAAGKSEAAERQFSISFTAKKAGKLSELLTINSRYTKAEGYGLAGEVRPVVLQFGQAASASFELYQNVPNPFGTTTAIGFHLPVASNAVLTIHDLSGRVVKEVAGEFSKGYHEITVEKTTLPERGVYYYRLETPGHTATRKLSVF